VERVTCSVCGYQYADKIPPGGDGTVLMPRKHKKYGFGLSYYDRQKAGDCPGSFQLAREYQEKKP